MTMARGLAGGQAEFDEGLNNGDIIPIVCNDDGKTYYRSRTISHVRRDGASSETRIGGKQEITRALADEATKQLRSCRFKWQLKDHEKRPLKKLVNYHKKN